MNAYIMINNYIFKLAQFVSNTGGIEFLVEIIRTKKTSTTLQAIMALGYIAGHSDELATVIIEMKAKIFYLFENGVTKNPY